MFKKLKENLKKSTKSLLLIFLSVAIFLSLFTFSADDNSVYKFDSSLTNYKNFFGYTGSLLSDVLLSSIGYCSYLLPLFFLFNGLRLIVGKEIIWYSWSTLPFLIMLFCFLIIFQ